MFSKVKASYRRFILRRLLKHRSPKSIQNYQQVTRVGMVFDVCDESNWSLVNKYADMFRSEGKQVWLLGIQHKNVVRENSLVSQNTTIFQESHDCNFLGIPSQHMSNTFKSLALDVLIDATSSPSFLTQYVLLISPALLKISYLNKVVPTDLSSGLLPVSEVCDFCIMGEGVFDVRYYLDNVIQYLKMVKK
ncbi:MAG: hypothetical protein KBT04_03515 [Bacteroidales bacterium]|nr:hypothetical protein [Candidatus Colimorpha onthohippi]